MSDEEKRQIVEKILAEQLQLDEDYNGDEQTPAEPNVDIFSPYILKQIEESKQNNEAAFQSYWEADEENISPWTKEQIDKDPAKQLISHAESGELDAIKDLFAKKIPAEIQTMLLYKDSDGYTAMHRACYSNCLDVIKYLATFENNPDYPLVDQFNARTDMGWTPLHSAVYWNNFKSVEYLLYSGLADVNVKTNSGQTSLHLAAGNSKTKETLILLLMHPLIDYKLKNDQGELAIDIARRSCKYHALFEMTEDHLNDL
jgi:ankyrin repeat protein